MTRFSGQRKEVLVSGLGQIKEDPVTQTPSFSRDQIWKCSGVWNQDQSNVKLTQSLELPI